MPIKEATENKEDKREFLAEDRRGKHKNHDCRAKQQGIHS
jgi:hypothetical protein